MLYGIPIQVSRAVKILFSESVQKICQTNCLLFNFHKQSNCIGAGKGTNGIKLGKEKKTKVGKEAKPTPQFETNLFMYLFFLFFF